MLNKLFFLLSFLFLSSLAIANEVYNVKGIKIAGSNEKSSVARDIAIEQGQIKAFNILVKRHFPEAVADLNKFKEDDILNTVAGFELSEERISATNYFAKMNVKFSRTHIDKIMKNFGAKFRQSIAVKEMVNKENIDKDKESFPEAVTLPTMVTIIIPVLEKEGQTYWIEDENEWLNFWSNKISSTDLKGKFVLPVGDLEDLSVLNKNILNKNIIDVSQILEKYNANNIALAKIVDLSEGNNHSLNLQLHYINKYSSVWHKHNFGNLEGSDVNSLFDKAYQDVNGFIFSTDHNHLIKNDKYAITKRNIISIDYITDNFSDWVYLEKLLTKSNYIDSLELQSMNINKYKFTLAYKISFLDLQNLLKKYNFTLQDQVDNKFILTRDNSGE